MGTSSARRGPTTPLWRQAKGAATRYLASEGGQAVTAGEVVARYLAALGESAGSGDLGALADFRLTRKWAQDLGTFWDQAASQGWDAALTARGLGALTGQPPEILAQGLSATLIGPETGLEGAVAQASLVGVLLDHLPPSSAAHHQPPPGSRIDSHQLIREFLAAALYRRLVFDLGEPLEAACRSFNRLRQGLAGIQERIAEAAAAPVALTPPLPEQWQGLTGWAWVTRLMAEMMRNLA